MIKNMSEVLHGNLIESKSGLKIAKMAPKGFLKMYESKHIMPPQRNVPKKLTKVS